LLDPIVKLIQSDDSKINELIIQHSEGEIALNHLVPTFGKLNRLNLHGVLSYESAFKILNLINPNKSAKIQLNQIVLKDDKEFLSMINDYIAKRPEWEKNLFISCLNISPSAFRQGLQQLFNVDYKEYTQLFFLGLPLEIRETMLKRSKKLMITLVFIDGSIKNNTPREIELTILTSKELNKIGTIDLSTVGCKN